MSFTTALYEGDSVIHTALRADLGVTPAGQPATALEIADLATAETKGWTVLVNVVWNALRSVGLWIEEKATQAHYRRVESYLARSSNHADLERRMRELGRHDRFKWIDCGSR